MAKIAERRKHSRVNTYLPVRMRLEQNGRYVETLAKNVSVGGLRCVIEGQLGVDDPVTLELPLFKESLPIETPATVAWVQSAVPAVQCVVGLTFSALSPADRQALTHYLERLPAALQCATD